MMEKFFSVVAELVDGTSSLLGVQSESSGAAFRQVRDRADVRRVGRVTAVTEAEFRRIEHGGAPVPAAAPKDAAPAPRREEAATTEIADRRAPAWVGHTISGPRQVVYAPPPSGEQPFKHLKAPPERPKPPTPAPQPTTRVEHKPARTAAPIAAKPQATSDAAPLPMPTQGGETEYRIQKSRRRDGLPYLLQRGQWKQLNGKRAFEIQWEKGFEGREQAERHLEWVQRTERELAEFQQSA